MDLLEVCQVPADIAVIILVRTREVVGAVPPRRSFPPAPRPNPHEYGCRRQNQPESTMRLNG